MHGHPLCEAKRIMSGPAAHDRAFRSRQICEEGGDRVEHLGFV